MSPATESVRRWSIVSAFLLAAFIPAGCGRAGPAAGKAVGRAGQAAAKEEAALARTVSQGGKAAAKHESEFVKGAKDFAKDHGRDVAEIVRDQMKEQQDTTSTGQRFPHPVSSVQPDPGSQMLYNEQRRQHARANNYGGFIFYNLAGNPIGFSAFNTATRQMDYFDQFGNRSEQF